MRVSFYTFLFVGVIWLAGCAVGPNYKQPKVATPSHFDEVQQTMQTNRPPADWWKGFNDPELDKLVVTALQENYELQIATARIRQARAQRNIAAANLFPEADADAGYALSRGSKNVKISLGQSGGSSGGSGGSSPQRKTPKAAVASQNSGSSEGSGDNNAFDNQLSPIGEGGLPGTTSDLYQTGFDASWEIDVFGGKRRLVEAAAAELAAANEGRRDMMVTLLAEVARNYLELRGTQERLEIANTNLAVQKEILEVTRSKRKHGLATDLDVTRATAQTESTAATLPPLQANERKMVHALSTLLAEEPEALSVELEAGRRLPPTPPEVPIGLPSQLIERRPDIRRAEREIAAANARIGSATADLFPKFAFIASAGLDASMPQSLFDWESRYFLISPTVTWRIFDAGRIFSNIRLQTANRQESVLQYRSTILKALQEVEDAIVNYATEQTRRTHLHEALDQNRQALWLARQQYDHGLVSFLNVLDAERTVFSSEDDLEQSDQTVTTDLVALYKALGGGWESEPSAGGGQQAQK
jgi:multidrug efflux system outer membrane protein